jgi:hypothetical protein
MQLQNYGNQLTHGIDINGNQNSQQMPNNPRLNTSMYSGSREVITPLVNSMLVFFAEAMVDYLLINPHPSVYDIVTYLGGEMVSSQQSGGQSGGQGRTNTTSVNSSDLCAKMVKDPKASGGVRNCKRQATETGFCGNHNKKSDKQQHNITQLDNTASTGRLGFKLPVLPGQSNTVLSQPDVRSETIPGVSSTLPVLPVQSGTFPTMPGLSNVLPVIPGSLNTLPVLPGSPGSLPVLPAQLTSGGSIFGPNQASGNYNTTSVVEKRTIIQPLVSTKSYATDNTSAFIPLPPPSHKKGLNTFNDLVGDEEYTPDVNEIQPVREQTTLPVPVREQMALPVPTYESESVPEPVMTPTYEQVILPVATYEQEPVREQMALPVPEPVMIPTYEQVTLPVPTYESESVPEPVMIPAYMHEDAIIPVSEQTALPVPTYEQMALPVPTYEQAPVYEEHVNSF